MLSQPKEYSPVTLTLARLGSFSEEEKDALEKIVHKQLLPKKTELLKVGQVSYKMYFEGPCPGVLLPERHRVTE